MGLAVADAHAVDDDRAHLAVEHFVGAGDFFFEAGGDGNHLEGRAGLVDVADRVVFERSGRISFRLLGLKVGRLVSARISPVCGFSTITVPAIALVSSIPRSSSRSAMAWMF